MTATFAWISRGRFERFRGLGNREAWSSMHDADQADGVLASFAVRIVRGAEDSLEAFGAIDRTMAVFDISLLEEEISTAYLLLGIEGYVFQCYNTWASSMGLNVFSANPSSPMTRFDYDYTKYGSVQLATTLPLFNGMSTAQKLILNPAGIAYLRAAKASNGIVKLGFRESVRDAPNISPNWEGEAKEMSATWTNTYLVINPDVIEPPPTGTMGWISQRFADASAFFYEIYLKVFGWIFPFNQVAGLFLALAQICADLSWDFFSFNEWINFATSRLAAILTFFDLEAWFLEWKQKILSTWDWIGNAWNNIKSDLENWWTVQVAELTEWWTSELAELQAIKSAWDNFWTVIFPTLVSFDWLGIWWDSQLIELDLWFRSELQELAPFWEGWQEVRSKVVDFFNDPLQWFYDRLEELFERFW